MKKRKKKLTKEKMQRNKILKYVIITIILGFIVYFLTSLITTKIMEAIRENNASNGEHSIFENIESIEDISIETFVKHINKELKSAGFSYQVKDELRKEKEAYLYDLDEEKQITLYLEPTKLLQDPSKETLRMSALYFPKEYQDKEEINSLVEVLFKAHNQDLTQENILQLLQNIEKTENTTQQGNSTTSEFFQYKGLEVSKKTDSNFISYRVGRIKKET